MLLDRGMAKEALAAFESTLAKDPGRFRAISGAAQAAQKVDDMARARRYHAMIAALPSSVGGSRPEVETARAFLANRR